MCSADRRLRRQDRLRRRSEFQRVGREGRRAASRDFVLLLAAGDGQTPRLGVTASRKVGNAVARNRVKRRIREWFRVSRCSLGGGPDVVVIARRGAPELSGREVSESLDELARQVGAGR